MNIKEFDDVYKYLDVESDDFLKIELYYQCPYVKYVDGIRAAYEADFTKRFLLNKKEDYKKIEQQKIHELILDLLLDGYLDSLNNIRKIKIHRWIHIFIQDKMHPSIKIKNGEIDYTITDLDLDNKKCRDMLGCITSIKNYCPSKEIVNIKDDKVDSLIMKVKEDLLKEFDLLHKSQNEINSYLSELTYLLDEDQRIDLIKSYGRFRVWFVTTYLVNLQKKKPKRY